MADSIQTRSWIARLIMTALFAIAWCGPPSLNPRSAQATGPGKQCTITTTTVKTLFGGTSHLKIVKQCVLVDPGGAGGSADSGPPTRTVVCGATKPDPCAGGGDQVHQCFGSALTGSTPFATQTRVKAKWSRPQIWCPGAPAPAAALAGLREQAQRLLPKVRVGSAWTDTALVNAEVILWADTGTKRPLNAAKVLGQQVRLRIGFEHADWDFGDGKHDSTTDPGKIYDAKHDPCNTKQCEHYYGHTYLHTGTVTVTLAVTWSAQFSLNGGISWTDIDGPITGPTSKHVLILKQARGVLIPDPQEH